MGPNTSMPYVGVILLKTSTTDAIRTILGRFGPWAVPHPWNPYHWIALIVHLLCEIKKKKNFIARSSLIFLVPLVETHNFFSRPYGKVLFFFTFALLYYWNFGRVWDERCFAYCFVLRMLLTMAGRSSKFSLQKMCYNRTNGCWARASQDKHEY